jgi:hypothetical protein
MKHLLLILLSTLCLKASGQQLLSAAGTSFTGGEIHASWSFGELAIESQQLNDLHVTQGLHQANLLLESIDEPAEENSAQLYPNPTNGVVHLNLDENTDVERLTILNSQGVEILSLAHKNKKIDLSDQPDGLYFIQIESENHKRNYQIIKQ